jgi:hypothetical protein
MQINVKIKNGHKYNPGHTIALAVSDVPSEWDGDCMTPEKARRFALALLKAADAVSAVMEAEATCAALNPPTGPDPEPEPDAI